jgi:hypothetical protein
MNAAYFPRPSDSLSINAKNSNALVKLARLTKIFCCKGVKSYMIFRVLMLAKANFAEWW